MFCDKGASVFPVVVSFSGVLSVHGHIPAHYPYKTDDEPGVMRFDDWGFAGLAAMEHAFCSIPDTGCAACISIIYIYNQLLEFIFTAGIALAVASLIEIPSTLAKSTP